ncbi:DUF4442 domain-containing protein [uncultured Bacteroides sp.]|uniref:PaaI family thioesterase n=1 Tax=uncultured Bacteroides sp. TaxID=162156 RepID=UPI0025FA94C9|nr:DUF4442 domain-containing protein [uncultured Bacteroides sp.]
MDVTRLPFNDFIGLKLSDNPHYILMLNDKAEYHNHLNTVHASAMFALAEATSGHYLLEQFNELSDIIPVVRKVEVKYRKPAIGRVYSMAKLRDIEKCDVVEAMNQKGRISLYVDISLFNKEDVLVMQATFEWFITKK